MLPPAMLVAIAPGLAVMHTGDRAVELVVVDERNTMPIESTAHAELDDDQEAAYRDEPSLR